MLLAAALLQLCRADHPGGRCCTNDCIGWSGGWAEDGWCDDGGPGAEFHGCALGSDCSDCSVRYEKVDGLRNESCLCAPARQMPPALPAQTPRTERSRRCRAHLPAAAVPARLHARVCEPLRPPRAATNTTSTTSTSGTIGTERRLKRKGNGPDDP